MKKINTIAIFILFLMNFNLGIAQDCIPETRVEDVEENKLVAKALKFFCVDNEITIEVLRYGKKKTAKVVYLRHSFLQDWEVYTGTDGNKYRHSVLVVGVKSAEDCKTIIFGVLQSSLGADKWGNPKVEDYKSFIPENYQKYKKEGVDCDCIVKIQNWLGSGTSETKTESKSEPVVNSNKNETNNTSNTSSVKDASGLPPLDKKKPGYYEAKDGNNLSDNGYKIKGKLEGEYRSYSNGQIEYVYNCKNGKYEGPATEYHENGKVKASGMFKNDKKDGEWKKFTEAGKPAGTDVYVDGEKQ